LQTGLLFLLGCAILEDLREFLCILSKIKDQSPYLQKMLSESQNMLFTFDGLLATLKKKRLLF